MSASYFLIHPRSKRMLDLDKAGHDLLANDSPPLLSMPLNGTRLLTAAGRRAINAHWSPWSGEFRQAVIDWLDETPVGAVFMIDDEFRFEHPDLAASMALDEHEADEGWTCEEASR